MVSTEQSALSQSRIGKVGTVVPGRRRIPVHKPASSRVLALVVGPILVFLILPTLVVAGISFGSASYIEFPPAGWSLRWYFAYFNDPAWAAATFFSLKIALMTTFAATVVGTLAAVALVRGNLPGKHMVQTLVLGPLIIPHIVFGVALYLVFTPLHMTGNFTGFLIAHTVLAVPYVVISVMAALQRFEVSFELAALSCGANRLQAFWHVILPGILPGISAGAVFAFLASFDEATVAFFLSDVGGQTVSSKMFEDIDFNLTPVIAAMSTILAVVSILPMGATRLAKRRQCARSFKRKDDLYANGNKDR